MAYYSHESLNNMIQEVEKEFPLGNSFFPTTNIRELIGNPDYGGTASRYLNL